MTEQSFTTSNAESHEKSSTVGLTLDSLRKALDIIDKKYPKPANQPDVYITTYRIEAMIKDVVPPNRAEIGSQALPDRVYGVPIYSYISMAEVKVQAMKFVQAGKRVAIINDELERYE